MVFRKSKRRLRDRRTEDFLERTVAGALGQRRASNGVSRDTETPGTTSRTVGSKRKAILSL
jgi:hypothetical protein